MQPTRGAKLRKSHGELIGAKKNDAARASRRRVRDLVRAQLERDQHNPPPDGGARAKPYIASRTFWRALHRTHAKTQRANAASNHPGGIGGDSSNRATTRPHLLH